MCGIAAIFSYRNAEPVKGLALCRMLHSMRRRGPDGEGEWYSENKQVGFGHKRLSIIDLSVTGAQPMQSADGKLVITFNGEIYNYQALRSELQARGRQFRSSSDTEVLLHLYELEGEAMVHKLRGMFAFAIWDATKRGIFIARDHFGIKPLYYSDDGKTVHLASQVKALKAAECIDLAPDPAGQVGFFLWGHMPEPYTLYKNIRALPAGSTLWIDSSGIGKVKSYCEISEVFAEAERQSTAGGCGLLGVSDFPEYLRTSLLDSVRHHLVADVPVGVFLSAGLDSTTLAALAKEVGGNLRTVTLAFNEFRGTEKDESILAEVVARQYGAQHQTIWVTRQDFQANFDRLLNAMDQPSVDGVNSFFISAAAQQAGLKVALSGLGGDELFGGYSSFRDIPRLVGHCSRVRHLPLFNRAVRIVSAPFFRRFSSPKYASLLEYGGTYGGAYLLRRGMYMPWELPDILDPELVRQGWAELQPVVRLDEAVSRIHSAPLKVSALEFQWYMRNQLLCDIDWASMDHSLEVRTPLVDIALLRAVLPLLLSPKVSGKGDMAAAARPPLSDEVLHRAKTGFAVPMREWLAEGKSDGGRGLRGWARFLFGHFGSENGVSACN